MADTIETHKDHLCELDGVIGDADHGITMSIGFTAVREAVGELPPADTTPTDILNTAAKSFLSAVGASAGPLYATAFMRAAASVKGQSFLTVEHMATAIEAMAEGIQIRGKAEAGDKTMLDAWLPAAEAARENRSCGDMSQLLSAVAAAAHQGAEDTIPLIAKKGRSAKLGERTRGHKDAGAASTALLLQALADTAATSQV
ncbi:MAG: dihydroxyacetone kinase subunit L [Gammaproteobacteria bacterium]|nr:dihydroxyacetone kinase subunit L [Gammaproteobacteria bacterium]